MKVLSYLEAIIAQNTEYFEFLFMNFDVRTKISQVKVRAGMMLQEFYSQTFYPRLITELFEGWEWNGEDVAFNDNLKVDICWQKENLIFTFNEHKLFFIYPRTLDDFINDCTRAGIELEWKLNK